SRTAVKLVERNDIGLGCSSVRVDGEHDKIIGATRGRCRVKGVFRWIHRDGGAVGTKVDGPVDVLGSGRTDWESARASRKPKLQHVFYSAALKRETAGIPLLLNLLPLETRPRIAARSFQRCHRSNLRVQGVAGRPIMDAPLSNMGWCHWELCGGHPQI